MTTRLSSYHLASEGSFDTVSTDSLSEMRALVAEYEADPNGAVLAGWEPREGTITSAQSKSDTEGKKVRKERVETTCLECGKVELRLPCYANRKFCDRKCAATYNNRKKSVGREARTCPVCETSFEVRPREKKVCCSFECAAEHKKTTVTKVCVECGESYERSADRADYSKWCSSKCRASGTTIYGMKPMADEEFAELYEKQGGKCAICGETSSYTVSRTEGKATEVKLVRDHCHEKMEWRGLLCIKCNTGLGMFGDDIETMTKAIAYIKEWSQS